MEALRFDGKVAVVTGAGRGLGRDYALLLASRGASVVVNDLGHGPGGLAMDEAPADIVVSEIKASGGNAVASRSSVTDGADQIIASALDNFGRLDILVNNAGFSGGGMFADIEAADWDHLLNTHIGGTVNMSRAAWPHLAATRAGRIINMSSSAAFGGPFTAHYSTAKSAMIGLTRSLAGEGRMVGMTVNAVMPSAYTRLTAQIPNAALCDYLERHFAPARVAPFVIWLAHEAASAVSGEIFAVGGGRACRVVLAKGPGVSVAADTPEMWAAQARKVMDIDHLAAPMNMMEALCLELRAIDDEGAALADTLATSQQF